MSDVITCPKCNSDQLQVGEKGYSLGKAAVGVITIGAIGALAGLHGKNKIKLSCLRCGNSWFPTLNYSSNNRSYSQSNSSTNHKANPYIQSTSPARSRKSQRTYTPGGTSKKHYDGMAKVFWGITLFNLLITTVLICTYFLF
ncbi:hypothetical protein [Metabacillus litoralis]|uniref:hypothetical protein n=1 Tax=Metabacillus litoralis TaxID=152268 RepID=UPI001CFE721C|nr:hypothetical protein [Metabacillus litoralis]